MSRPRILVVGAGIVGLCAAWHLQRAGAQVTVVDRAGPGEGTSSGNAGAISQGSVAPLAMPGVLKSVPGMLLDPKGALHIPPRAWPAALPWLWRFVLAARPERVQDIAEGMSQLLAGAETRHREILREEGAEELLRDEGQLYLYRDAAHLAKDESAWALRREYGQRTEILDRAGIEALENGISPDYTVGVFLPEQGHILNPLRHARVVARGVERLGGEIRRAEVTDLVTENGRVTGIRAGGETLLAEHVVLAAGTWSRDLLRRIGLDVPLIAQRGYHVMIPDPGLMPRRPLVPADRKAFVTPMEEGLRVAGTVEFGANDAPPSPRRAALLLDDLRKLLPGARAEGAKPFWMGHRPCLPDTLPVMGPVAARPGLWCCFGHGHLGLTASAPAGAMLARAMLGPPANTDLSAFALERFA
ncbi:NAD(P)/FAD-dependent oxidoreductase [Sabulicella glaciei]|uniref:FAD-dependent oxidoreductase n=1 Tax=Sabulicella glaciei TaxID=2984948 RepID=A0ABT3NT88_9PROT|nr:FAD-dependent oxidoreductase [Roseococcus sp. MDT2-1-1]